MQSPETHKETVLPRRRLDRAMGLRFTTRSIAPPDVPALLRQATAAYVGEDRIVIHVGAVAVVEAADRSELQALRGRIEGIAIDDDDGAAVWLGGIAFDGPGDGPWTGFPAARFCLPSRQWRCIDGAWTETACDAPVLPTSPTQTGMLASADRTDWGAMVQAALQSIQSGEVTKVVLARCHETAPGDPVDSLLRLLETPAGTGFLMRFGATFFGCTPERLVRLAGGAVTTHALAGSARRGKGDQDAALGHALQGSGKDVLEHELVVAFLRERLVEAGVTGVHQASRQLRRLRHVQHLETPIHGTAAPGSHVLDLAAALHPTPAVCGTPRQKSLALIRHLEAFPRGWYAGAIGWFDAAGEGELSVALRCALDTGAARYLFAGAGIVAGSNADDEWAETETKLAAMKEVS